MPEENKLLKYELAEQVRQQMVAQLKTWGAMAALVLTILGFFGIREYLSYTKVRQEMADQAAQLQKEAEALRLKADQATRDMESARRMREESAEFITKSLAMLMESSRNLQEGSTAITARMKDLRDETEKQSAEFAKRNEETLNRLKQANEAQKNVQEQANTLGEVQSKVREQQASLEKAQSDLEQNSSKLTARVQGLDTFEAQQKELNEAYESLVGAAAVDFVRLRTRRPVTVELPDFRPGRRGQVWHLEFTATKTKNVIDVEVREGSNRTGLSSKPPLIFRDLSQGVVRPLEESPFVFRVEFIYHAKLAYDFAELKLMPKPEEVRRLREAVGAPQ